MLHFGEDRSSGKKSLYPIVGVKNVTIFPGVPHLLENAFALMGKVGGVSARDICTIVLHGDQIFIISFKRMFENQMSSK